MLPWGSSCVRLDDWRYEIHTIGMPDYLPRRSKLVRIPVLESTSVLEDHAGRATLTQYAQCDLGGALPGFLLKMVIPKKMGQPLSK